MWETLQEQFVWFQSVSVARLLALASVEDATDKLKTLSFAWWFALLVVVFLNQENEQFSTLSCSQLSVTVCVILERSPYLAAP